MGCEFISVDTDICSKGGVLRLADDQRAWNLATGLKGRSLNGKKLESLQEPLACRHVRMWYLYGCAGFMTRVHKDATGFATWVEVLEGDKWWMFLRAKPGYQYPTWEGATPMERRLSQELWITSITMEQMVDAYDLYVVRLVPGLQL